MNIARTILDGIVMCAVFNAVVGLFFFVCPQAYSTMFPRGMKKAAKPYVKKDEVIKLYCILIPLYLLMFLYMAASARRSDALCGDDQHLFCKGLEVALRHGVRAITDQT